MGANLTHLVIKIVYIAYLFAVAVCFLFIVFFSEF